VRTIGSIKPAVMGAIVTTLLWLPGGALLALLCYLLLDISLDTFLTLGHSLPHASVGLLAWWAIGFVPAYAYALLISAHD
jgi:hypothetical protein